MDKGTVGISVTGDQPATIDEMLATIEKFQNLFRMEVLERLTHARMKMVRETGTDQIKCCVGSKVWQLLTINSVQPPSWIVSNYYVPADAAYLINTSKVGLPKC